MGLWGEGGGRGEVGGGRGRLARGVRNKTLAAKGMEGARLGGRIMALSASEGCVSGLHALLGEGGWKRAAQVGRRVQVCL